MELNEWEWVHINGVLQKSIGVADDGEAEEAKQYLQLLGYKRVLGWLNLGYERILTNQYE